MKHLHVYKCMYIYRYKMLRIGLILNVSLYTSSNGIYFPFSLSSWQKSVFKIYTTVFWDTYVLWNAYYNHTN